MRKLIILFVLVSLLSLSGCSSTFNGKVETFGNAVDDELGVTCDSAILVREVEMVQYYKYGDGKVELVLANYPIESFDSYNNPEFPEDITSKIFFSSVKIGNNELSEDQIKSLVYSNQEELTKLRDLPEDVGNKYGLILNDGAYISASNEWKIGEIRITYYIMNIDESKEYFVISKK